MDKINSVDYPETNKTGEDKIDTYNNNNKLSRRTEKGKTYTFRGSLLRIKSMEHFRRNVQSFYPNWAKKKRRILMGSLDVPNLYVGPIK